MADDDFRRRAKHVFDEAYHRDATGTLTDPEVRGHIDTLAELLSVDDELTRLHAARATVYYAGPHVNCDYIVNNGTMQLLLFILTSHDPSRPLLEAVLAALSRLAQAPVACDCIANIGFRKIVALLGTTLSITVNTLALLEKLATHEKHKIPIVRTGAVGVLFGLRSHGMDDVRKNAENVLKVLGLSSRDPDEEYKRCFSDLKKMGFHPGDVDAALISNRTRKADVLATWLIEHPATKTNPVPKSELSSQKSLQDRQKLVEMGFSAEASEAALLHHSNFNGALEYLMTSSKDVASSALSPRSSVSNTSSGSKISVGLEPSPVAEANQDTGQIAPMTPLPPSARPVEQKKQQDIHFGFLEAAPLINSETEGSGVKLNFKKEKSVIHSAVRFSQRAIRVNFDIATMNNLLSFMIQGVKAVHISGHGYQSHLVMEDNEGGANLVEVDELNDILKKGAGTLQFVFISACHSSRVADAFVKAGVPHVIAVEENNKVLDDSAREFARGVYKALFKGKTVMEAYGSGQAAVSSMPQRQQMKSCCCAHIHSPTCKACLTCGKVVCCSKHARACHQVKPCCKPNLPHMTEAHKFLLYPDIPGAHETALFDTVPLGSMVDESVTPPHNLPAPHEDMLGRANDVYNILQHVFNSRFITLHGPNGIGKSVVAKAAGHYINPRRHFRDGVFYYTFEDAVMFSSSHEILEVVGAELLDDILTSSASPSPAPSGVDSSEDDRKSPASVLSPVLSPTSTPSSSRSSVRDPFLRALRNKEMLLIFDNCDGFQTSAVRKTMFKSFLKRVLDKCPNVKILVTATAQFGKIEGVAWRKHRLQELPKVASANLLFKRRQRRLSHDAGDFQANYTSIQEFSSHPLFDKIPGNPRLIETCAELLHEKMNMMELAANIRKDSPQANWSRFSEDVRAELERLQRFFAPRARSKTSIFQPSRNNSADTYHARSQSSPPTSTLPPLIRHPKSEDSSSVLSLSLVTPEEEETKSQ